MAKKKGVRIDILPGRQGFRPLRSQSARRASASNQHKVHVEPYPVGKNTKQWVTQQYPAQGPARSPQSGGAGRVACSARTRMSKPCNKGATPLPPHSIKRTCRDERTDETNRAFGSSKWHIETWITALLGQNVNENDNYKHAAQDADVPGAAKGFVDRFRVFKQDATIQILPSLKTAFEETRRLDA